MFMHRLTRAIAFLCNAMPLLLLASPFACGQTATPASPSQAQNAQTATPAAQPTAKVWTNDDVGDLRNDSTVSTVGQGNGSKKAIKPTPATTKNNRAGSYQSRIAKLQAQLPPLDGQIADLQAALSGNMVNEQRKYPGVKLDDWQAQLAHLQKRRDDLRTQIAKLEDEARHSGVPNNALP